MNRTLIITGGEINEQFLVDEVKQDYETIIAVDKGLETAQKLNIKINHIIGDFDSVNTKILESYKNINIIKLNPEKDYTDTHMGVKLAIEQGSKDITIVGWFGTRMDHVLGNINIMKEAMEQNISCRLINKTNEIKLINKKTILKKDEKYKYVSLIPLTTEVSGITLEGFKYPLQEATLKIGESIGISNEITAEKATIDIKNGILILIKSKD